MVIKFRNCYSSTLTPVKQAFFQGFFKAVLSFETQSSHQSFSAVKMKFELNS